MILVISAAFVLILESANTPSSMDGLDQTLGITQRDSLFQASSEMVLNNVNNKTIVLVGWSGEQENNKKKILILKHNNLYPRWWFGQDT